MRLETSPPVPGSGGPLQERTISAVTTFGYVAGIRCAWRRGFWYTPAAPRRHIRDRRTSAGAADGTAQGCVKEYKRRPTEESGRKGGAQPSLGF